MNIDMNKLIKARTSYIIGMALTMVAVYALITCSNSLFKLTDNFPVVPLAIASLVLLAYNFVSAWLYIRIVKTQENSLVNFYLASRIVRMLLCIITLTVLALMIKTGILSLVLSFMLLYIITMVYESVFFVQIEKKINDKQTK